MTFDHILVQQDDFVNKTLTTQIKMPQRSGRLASRQLGDADTLALLETSLEELEEASSMHEEAPEEWGEDYDNDNDYDDDRDHTPSRRKKTTRAVATPASSMKIRGKCISQPARPSCSNDF